MIEFSIPLRSLILFIIGGALLMWSGAIARQIIGKINRHLPDDQQIGYVVFYPSKAFRISREYRRLYPGGRLDIIRKTVGVVGGTLIVIGGMWR